MTKRKYFTPEQLAEEALKYPNRSTFKKKSPGAYKKVKQLGKLDEYCKHMPAPRKKVPDGHWNNLDNVFNEALKYTSRNEFTKQSESAYKVALESGKMDEICAHMKDSKSTVPIGHWNVFDNVKAVALEYSTRAEFISNNPSAYSGAVRNGWLEEVCSHMLKPHECLIKWTPELIREEALKYQTISEFQQNASGAHKRAKALDIIEDVTSHMQEPFTWKVEDIRKLAANYKYQKDFVKDHKNAYRAALKFNILDELGLIKNKKESRFSKQDTLVKALLCETLSDFSTLYSDYYSAAQRSASVG